MTLAAMVPRVDKYDLLEEIGHGGMATVFRARDPRLSRDVAVKVIHRHLRESAEVARRFTAEARAVAKLRHPNIVEIYDVGEDDAPERYLVAELVGGGSLRKLLAQSTSGPLPAEIAACIAVELADGLAHAHERGVVHRDVKPENVLFELPSDEELQEEDAEVRVKLTDFGIAKMLDQQGVTATGQVLGSPAYMAPEQIECGDIDARSDIFGLGVLFYETMVGHPPFEGKNPAQVLRRVLDGVYTPADQDKPTVGAVWSRIAAVCLAMRVEDRYPDMDSLRQELSTELASLGIHEPRKELARFFRDPEGYRTALAERLIPILVERGKAARKADDVVGAAGHFNRALAFAPHDAALLTLVSGMTRRRERKALALRLGGVVGVLCLGTAIGALVLRALPSRNGGEAVGAAGRAALPITADPTGSAPPNASAPNPSASGAVGPGPSGTGQPSPPTTSTGTTSTTGRVVGPQTVSTVTPPPFGGGPSGGSTDPPPVERRVSLSVNIPRALISIDGGPAEEIHGAVRMMKTGLHAYTFQMSEETRECCRPTSGSFQVRPPPALGNVAIHVNLNFAKLAVDGPASDQVFCSFFQGARQASGVINVPVQERTTTGTCYLQSSPDRRKSVVLRPGVTTPLQL
jgi:eukaryotic-like serine/threonine-protein kinase